MSLEDITNFLALYDSEETQKNNYRKSSVQGPLAGVPPGFAPLSPQSRPPCNTSSPSGSPGVIQRPNAPHKPATSAAEILNCLSQQSAACNNSPFSNTMMSSRSTLLQQISSTMMTSPLANASPMTSQSDYHSQPQGALAGGSAVELLNLHRRLSRTASDPISAAALAAAMRAGPASLGLAADESSPLEGSGGSNGAVRYKTELCRPFEEHGACKYGDKCQFAHGRQELRSLSRHPKYKTDMCKTYHTTGLCPYGPRCHFIHDTEDTVAVDAIRSQAAKLSRQRSQQLEGLFALQQLQLEQLQLEQLQLEQLQKLEQPQQLDAVKQRLLIAALTSQQQRRLSGAQVGRSDSAPSTVRYTPRAALRSSPSPPFSKTLPIKSSVCDSLGSLGGVNSPPSSLSESPSGSPGMSMFGGECVSGDEATFSSLPVNSTASFSYRDMFSRSNSRPAGPPGLSHRAFNHATPPASAGFYQSNSATPTSASSFVYPGSPFASVHSPAVSAFADSSSVFSGRPAHSACDSFPAAEVVAASLFGGATPGDMLRLAALLQELAVTKAAAGGLQPLSPSTAPLLGGGLSGTGWERGFQDATQFSAGGIVL